MSKLMGLFVIPFITATLAFFLPIKEKKTLKMLNFIFSLFPLILLVVGQGSWIGSSLEHDWIPLLAIKFHLSLDALSLIFIYLTAIIIPISLLALPRTSLTHPHAFYSLVFLLQGLLIGLFLARDLVVFTFFWEASLLPLFFMINFWGGAQRREAAFKFLIYLLAGSALMVAAVLSLYLASGTLGEKTFNMDVLARVADHMPYALWICAIFLLAFAVKTPLFPFHGWLPDAYYQAPVAGTILLSAILSKAGIYGFLRIGVELFPTALREWSPLLLGLAIVGVLYGGLAAWMQSDYKRLIAYSSFSHVNFVLVGVFIWDQVAHSGAILQAFNHGITIAALFLVAGWLQERLHSTTIGKASGVAHYFPCLCWMTLFFVLSSVALPGLNNFIGEVFILFGLFKHNPWLAALLGLTVILSVIYMLRWLQKVYFEEPHLENNSEEDIHLKEWAIALPLMALILWIGLYPTPILNYIQSTTEKIVVPTNVEESQ